MNNTETSVGESTSIETAFQTWNVYIATHPLLELPYIGASYTSLDVYNTSSPEIYAVYKTTGIRPTFMVLKTGTSDRNNRKDSQTPFLIERELYLEFSKTTKFLNSTTPSGFNPSAHLPTAKIISLVAQTASRDRQNWLLENDSEWAETYKQTQKDAQKLVVSQGRGLGKQGFASELGNRSAVRQAWLRENDLEWVEGLAESHRQATLKQMELGTGMFSEESKRKAAEFVRELWKDPEYAQNHPFLSKEARAKALQTRLERFRTDETYRDRRQAISRGVGEDLKARGVGIFNKDPEKSGKNKSIKTQMDNKLGIFTQTYEDKLELQKKAITSAMAKGTNTFAFLRQLCECGLETNIPNMSRHLKKSGHTLKKGTYSICQEKE